MRPWNKLQALSDYLVGQGLEEEARTLQQIAEAHGTPLCHTAGSYQQNKYRKDTHNSLLGRLLALKYGITEKDTSREFEMAYGLLGDIADVAFNNKPAAIFDNIIHEYYPEVTELLIGSILRMPGYKIIKFPRTINEYIIGKNENVDAIFAAIERKVFDKEYHRTMGENLGYSKEDIDEFVAEKHKMGEPEEDAANEATAPFRRNLDYGGY